MVRSLVFCGPEMLLYSHDCIAKKKTLIKSLHRALLNWDKASLWNILRMEAVMAACEMGGLSVVAYPRS